MKYDTENDELIDILKVLIEENEDELEPTTVDGG